MVDADGPVVLVAHSLGCILTAWWAAHSRNTHKVQGALLVAPGDVESPEVAPLLPGWSPIARQPLPFPATLVASRNDPYCHWDRATALAAPGARSCTMRASAATSTPNPGSGTGRRVCCYRRSNRDATQALRPFGPLPTTPAPVRDLRARTGQGQHGGALRGRWNSA